VGTVTPNMYGKSHRCARTGSIIHLLPQQFENTLLGLSKTFSVLVIKKFCVCVTIRTNVCMCLIQDDI